MNKILNYLNLENKYINEALTHSSYKNVCQICNNDKL